ncbi:hypothetical protein P3X46_012531 [Hevea brasiliensis]|uniref:Uncharacterized protein n=1 Tax=Hevea brasiliensis TaxID=3981 RepID=A0ABQ9MCU9_HEVBR|nr:hypothetical protein P3X46_012531 [Hevea brasiliensis]
MRQFGSTQSRIDIEEYHQGHFYHELKEEERLKMARKSWENITLMERSPKGPSATRDYLKWRADRDKEYSNTEFEDSDPRRDVLLEEADDLLVDSLQKANTENSQLQEQIKQLEDKQQILKRKVRRLREEARAEKMGFEEQEIRWEKEKNSLHAVMKEVEAQNNKLQEKTKYQEILVEEYKQENKKKKLELKEQTLLINDILKECAKERKEKERQTALYQELKENVDQLERTIAQGKQELLPESEYALKAFDPAKQEERLYEYLRKCHLIIKNLPEPRPM